VKESHLTPVGGEWECGGVFQNKAVLSGEPRAVRPFNTVRDVHGSDQPAHGKGVWVGKWDVGMGVHDGDVPHVVKRFSGVDKERPSVVGAPRAIFNIFVAVDDEPRPRLSNGQGIHSIHSAIWSVIVV